MNQKAIKILCKILKVMGYFFMGGGFLGIFMGVRFEEWEEMIFKASTLALFFGGFRLESAEKALFRQKASFLSDKFCARLPVPAFLFRVFFAMMFFRLD